ncbi:Conserved_hypothetical protein [Hexamita inflata]|uniref:Uncharacterized protein n=1 Tax=Hexamita inflata TaxID=28002 RepID=A0AA86QG75_9EUKA|nr:Conserved hypothetical protein [Hexamita inflata]
MQTIQDSSINVTLEFEVQQAALICITCDVLVSGSTLVFVASGQQLSAVVMVSIKTTQFERSFIQFRFKSASASGLVNIINSSIDTFIVSGCNISGYNYIRSDNNGFVSSQISQPITINISQLQVCVNQPRLLGLKSVSINQVGSETTLCTLCEGSNVIYGICADALLFSQDVGGMLQCVYPFEYTGTQCICVLGYLLNQTVCVNVVENLTDLSRRIDNNYLLNNNNITMLYNKLNLLDKNIVDSYTMISANLTANTNILEQNIISNHSQLNQIIFDNISTLDNRINGNITQLQQSISSNFTAFNYSLTQKIAINMSILENNISSNYSKAESNLAQNTTVLDARIFGNATSLGSYLVNNISTLNNSVLSSLAASSIYLEHQIVNNYTGSDANLQRNTSTLEQRLNGNFSALTNSIINNISALNTTAQNNLKQNSSQIEKYILGNFSKTDLNLLSNTSIIEQRIIGNYSNLGNQMLNSISTLNSQLMQNLKINSSNLEHNIIQNYNFADSKLLSNTSSLQKRVSDNITATNSTLTIINQLLFQLQQQIICTSQYGYSWINGICVLTGCLIYGQVVNNGVCVCANNYILQNDKCVFNTFEIFVSNLFVCTLPILQIQILDLQNITHIVSDMSQGYAFSSGQDITSAYIEVYDNILTNSCHLFQSQNIFNNLKIQIRTQVISGTASIITSVSTIKLYYVIIMSKPGTYLNTTDQLNIVSAYTTFVDIVCLTLNLNIYSTGNFSLVNYASKNISINTFRVLGKYQSTGTVAIIAIYTVFASVHIDYIFFEPEIINIGNCSSYMFSDMQNSTTLFNNILIKILNKSQSTSSVYSNSNLTYQFGGLITNILNSQIKIKQIIFQSQHLISTQYVSRFGIIIGFANQYLNSINIYNLCMDYNIIQSKFVNNMGLIGYSMSEITIYQCSIQLMVYGQQLMFIGLVGKSNSTLAHININNVESSVQIQSENYGSQVSGIIGFLFVLECQIYNTKFSNSIINVSSNTAGLIGQTYQKTLCSNISLIISDTIISNFICGGLSNSGFIGYAWQTNVIIQNSIIDCVELIKTTNSLIVGSNSGSSIITLINSGSKGVNIIHNIVQNNCIVFTSTDGC